MKKFLVEFFLALLALLIIPLLVVILAPESWFLPTIWPLAALVFFYIYYRFSRLWSRRCRECDGLNIVYEKHMRRPDGIPPVGWKLECEIVVICLNRQCSQFLQEQVRRDYIKSFSSVEIW